MFKKHNFLITQRMENNRKYSKLFIYFKRSLMSKHFCWIRRYPWDHVIFLGKNTLQIFFLNWRKPEKIFLFFSCTDKWSKILLTNISLIMFPKSHPPIHPSSFHISQNAMNYFALSDFVSLLRIFANFFFLAEYKKFAQNLLLFLLGQ